MAIPRYFRFKRKSERCRIKGWAKIEAPYIGVTVPGILADVSVHGVGVRVTSDALNVLLGQPAHLTITVPGWDQPATAYVIVERHVAKSKGRLIGLRFVSIDDDSFHLICQYIKQHKKMAA